MRSRIAAAYRYDDEKDTRQCSKPACTDKALRLTGAGQDDDLQ